MKMVQLSALIFVVGINKQQTARLLACKRRHRHPSNPKKNSLLQNEDESDMRFSKRSSSSFGTDSDIDEEHNHNIILGSGNNHISTRVKPAISNDKIAIHQNANQDKTIMISPDLVDDKQFTKNYQDDVLVKQSTLVLKISFHLINIVLMGLCSVFLENQKPVNESEDEVRDIRDIDITH